MNLFSKNKKIAIVGYGREGKSLANFLLEHGQNDITILDKNSNLLINSLLKFELGNDYLKNLNDFDLIYVSPGVPYFRKKWDKVKDKISSSTNLFFNLCPAKIIGVTGTKGKGTTCRLLEKILNFSWAGDIFLGGNIGLPLISFLNKLSKKDLVIAELSSFQLQNLKRSPNVAVITNLLIDHLNYHRTIEEYHQSKLNILRYQTKKDVAIINLSLIKQTEKIGQGRKYYFSIAKNSNSMAYYDQGWLIIKDKREERIIKESEIKILGKHNRENILAAALTSYLMGAPKKIISQQIKKFRLSRHHLELILEKNGIKVVDDSAATNPSAMIAAIRSFFVPIILIAGGQDKGFDYSQLKKDLEKEKRRIKLIILLGENKNDFYSAVPMDIETIKTASLEEAVKIAWMRAEKNDVILFSPGAASLDMFKNAQERGEIFKKINEKMLPDRDSPGIRRAPRGCGANPD